MRGIRVRLLVTVHEPGWEPGVSRGPYTDWDLVKEIRVPQAPAAGTMMQVSPGRAVAQFMPVLELWQFTDGSFVADLGHVVNDGQLFDPWLMLDSMGFERVERPLRQRLQRYAVATATSAPTV